MFTLKIGTDWQNDRKKGNPSTPNFTLVNLTLTLWTSSLCSKRNWFSGFPGINTAAGSISPNLAQPEIWSFRKEHNVGSSLNPLGHIYIYFLAFQASVTRPPVGANGPRGTAGTLTTTKRLLWDEWRHVIWCWPETSDAILCVWSDATLRCHQSDLMLTWDEWCHPVCDLMLDVQSRTTDMMILI